MVPLAPRPRVRGGDIVSVFVETMPPLSYPAWAWSLSGGRVSDPPLQGHHPGGGEFNEESKGSDIFSGSGARGSTGHFEGAAGQ